MTFWTLPLRNLRAHWGRNLLTIVGVAAATVTWVLIQTVLSMWAMGEEYTARNRVATRHKATYVMNLPLRYVDVVAATDGVVAAVPMSWFGGRLPNHEQEYFATMATDASKLFAVYNELELPVEQRQAWEHNGQGAIVGEVLAQKFGWKLGDRVTLAGTIYPGDWAFTVEGIYSASRKTVDRSAFYFHWRRLNEEVRPELKDQVGWIVSRARSDSEVSAIVKRIDDKLDSESTQTLSTSEHALSASFFGMMAALLRGLDLISAIIAVIIILVMGNTLAMSVRERTKEYAVMRAIGFAPAAVLRVVLIEAACLGLLGVGCGLLLALPLINAAIGPAIESMFGNWFPYFRVTNSDALLALQIGVLGACASVLGPALRATRLSVHDALRVTG